MRNAELRGRGEERGRVSNFSFAVGEGRDGKDLVSGWFRERHGLGEKLSWMCGAGPAPRSHWTNALKASFR